MSGPDRVPISHHLAKIVAPFLQRKQDLEDEMARNDSTIRAILEAGFEPFATGEYDFRNGHFIRRKQDGDDPGSGGGDDEDDLPRGDHADEGGGAEGV